MNAMTNISQVKLWISWQNVLWAIKPITKENVSTLEKVVIRAFAVKTGKISHLKKTNIVKRSTVTSTCTTRNVYLAAAFQSTINLMIVVQSTGVVLMKSQLLFPIKQGKLKTMMTVCNASLEAWQWTLETLCHPGKMITISVQSVNVKHLHSHTALKLARTIVPRLVVVLKSIIKRFMNKSLFKRTAFSDVVQGSQSQSLDPNKY